MQRELNLAEREKEVGIGKVSERNNCWVDNAVLDIQLILHAKGSVTADDLRHLPPPKHPNAIGAAFNRAAKLGIIKRVGFVKSQYASTHARFISEWREA